jgi:hypothetical protein
VTEKQESNIKQSHDVDSKGGASSGVFLCNILGNEFLFCFIRQTDIINLLNFEHVCSLFISH